MPKYKIGETVMWGTVEKKIIAIKYEGTEYEYGFWYASSIYWAKESDLSPLTTEKTWENLEYGDAIVYSAGGDEYIFMDYSLNKKMIILLQEGMSGFYFREITQAKKEYYIKEPTITISLAEAEKELGKKII